MNPKVLVSVHGYSGDASQVSAFIDLYTHHGYPVVIVSPDDAPIRKAGPHICRTAGLREYFGQKSWNRQNLQMRLLLEYKEFDWFLMNDSDSFVLNPKLPDYIFEDENVLYSNLVDDFRIPGQVSHGQHWPEDYHKGYPLKASQPPYFCSRKVMEKMVSVDPSGACPITPFIDWCMVKWAVDSGVELKPFRDGQGASCETVTRNGAVVMNNCIRAGAIFVHSFKTRQSKDIALAEYNRRNK